MKSRIIKFYSIMGIKIFNFIVVNTMKLKQVNVPLRNLSDWFYLRNNDLLTNIIGLS